mgnify:CR=1 FL=1
MGWNMGKTMGEFHVGDASDHVVERGDGWGEGGCDAILDADVGSTFYSPIPRNSPPGCLRPKEMDTALQGVVVSRARGPSDGKDQALFA